MDGLLQNRPLTIGSVPKLAGVPPTTVRFYERAGVVRPGSRTAANYRLYPRDAVARMLEGLEELRGKHVVGPSMFIGSRRKRPVLMVPATGLEPVRCYSLEPESSASANSATRALEHGAAGYFFTSVGRIYARHKSAEKSVIR